MRDRYANIGIVKTATIVSSHERISIATRAAATTVTLDRMLTTVSVSTSCVLETSLASRDWMSPVFVEEKNDMGCFNRWLYTRCRISSITLKPTAAFRRDWPKLSTPEMPAAATMPPISHNNRFIFCCGKASSMTRWINRGVMTPRAEVISTNTPTTANVDL